MARYRSISAFVLALALFLSVFPVASAVAADDVQAAAVRSATYFGGDAYDSVDSTWTSAPTLPPVSRHTFASLATKYGFTADEDWFKVSVSATGTPVVINVTRVAGQGGSYLDVYASNGGSVDATSFAFYGPADAWFGPALVRPAAWWASAMSSTYFVAPHPGTYYFRHRPAAGVDAAGYDRDAIPNVVNQAVTYDIHVIVGDADRIAGSSRYGTSAAVSRQMWNAADDPFWAYEGPWGNGVILASGQNFADGLAASSFSVRTAMPVLLTGKDFLPAEVRTEIERLANGMIARYWDGDNTFTVYIAGSNAAISDAVEDQLRSLGGVKNVVRLEGRDRYATAVAIADEASSTALYNRLRSAGGPAPLGLPPREAFVINGFAWADGLAAGPVAAAADAPVLMVTQTGLPNVTRDWLVSNNIRQVHVVGGPTVVAQSVLDAIASLPTTPTVDRIAGGTRYETAYRVAKYGVDNYWMSGEGVNVVSGESPWDALSAGQLSFMTRTPLMLTPRLSLSPWVEQFESDSAGFSQPSYVVGGEPAVSAAAYNKLRDLWK